MQEEMEKLYFNDLKGAKILSREELLPLIKRAQARDRDARDKVVKSCLRFVVGVANQYRGDKYSKIDIIGEGNLGLLMAIDRFDTARDVSFLSYAVWWIRQSIERALQNDFVIRAPNNVVMSSRRVIKELGPDASVGEIVALEGCSKGAAEDILRHLRQTTVSSLDADTSAEGEEKQQYYDTIGIYDDIEQDLDDQRLKDGFYGQIMALPAKEREVMTLMYFTNPGETLTLADVSMSMGVTRERVRQIRNRAIERLRRDAKIKAEDVHFGSDLPKNAFDLFD